MIKVYEGLGGWTIKVVKGKKVVKEYECTQYTVVDKHGINWFDIDAAMNDAEEYDKNYGKSSKT